MKDRHIQWAVLLLVLLGCLVVLASRSFLFAESSERLVIVLEHGMAYRVEQAQIATRPMSWIPMLPVIGLSKLTQTLTPLVYTYGAGFVFVPLLSVLGVLGFAKRNPSATAVAVAAICLISLPGQVFVVSGHLMTSQLYWVFLVCVVMSETSLAHRFVLPVFVIGLSFLHAVSGVMFGITGGYLLLRSWKHRRWRLIACGLCLAAVARAALVFSTSDKMRIEDASHPSANKLLASFSHPRVELIVLYFALVLAACAVLHFRRRISLALFLAAGASLLSFFWGNRMGLQHGVHYIAWIFAMSLPLHILFLELALRAPKAESPGAALRLAPPLIFVTVLGVQSFAFVTQLEEAREMVDAWPELCVPRGELFTDVESSFAEDFGYFEYIYAATGPTRFTKRVVLDHERCDDLCRPAYQTPEQAGGIFLVEKRAASGRRVYCPVKDLLQ